MDKQQLDQQRFARLLPFYADHTLDAIDLTWMESYIADNTDVKKQLVSEMLMRDTAHRVQPAEPGSQRLVMLLRSLEQTHVRDHWLKRWSEQCISSFLRYRIAIPRSAFAMLVLVVIGQTVYTLGGVSSESESDANRGKAAPCVQELRLRTGFNPDARHAEVLLLLRKVEASVKAGPTENGELWITVPPSRFIEEAQSILRTTPLVDDVVLSPATSGPAGCRP